MVLSGIIENIVFRNEDNGWTVFELDSGDELVTAVGLLFQVSAGDQVKIIGDWVTHPIYGRQFKVSSYEKTMPATETAMYKYLSSGAVKGIGPVTARRIIDMFGSDTLNVIEKHPERLVEIRGISPQKAQSICEDYNRQFGIRNCMLFLQQYGVTPAEAVRVWRRFGLNAVDMIKSNPYILCSQGLWISFDRADDIAAAMGYTADAECRIRAGILFVLRHNLNSGGHTYIPYSKLVSAAAQLLGVECANVEANLEKLIDETEVIAEDINFRRGVFIPYAYTAEAYVAGRIKLMTRIDRPVLGSCSVRIKQAEKQYGIKYAEKQAEAIETAYKSGVMILTGGPGTGKTTTINAIISVYEGMGLKVALAAPTGRAAKRMSDVTGREAKTIHRLLEVEFREGAETKFAKNEKNPLDCDAVIVDELSMVDIFLLESLLRALKLTCRLVMVGDADQLPPVGAGNALRDMIDSGLIPVVHLDEIFRQAAQSLIVTNAHKIVRGEIPEISRRDGDFFFIQKFTQPQIMQTVTELVKSRLPNAYGYSPLWDIQVLTPGRRGELGSIELNEVLQQALNPMSQDKSERKFGTKLFRQGDKVMQTKNNYDVVWLKDNGEKGSGIFNGDVGVLEELDRRTGMMRVRFEDRVAEYTSEGTEELELAYATTVHKSQGSEFKAVVMPLFSGAPKLLYRNLLYTAVTRAKELVIIVGKPSVFEQMVLNDRRTKRYTGLCRFLKEDDSQIQQRFPDVNASTSDRFAGGMNE